MNERRERVASVDELGAEVCARVIERVKPDGVVSVKFAGDSTDQRANVDVGDALGTRLRNDHSVGSQEFGRERPRDLEDRAGTDDGDRADEIHAIRLR